MATIITKNSSTASSVPTAAQLLQGELAVNVTDKRLFTENASGTVVELGTNPSSLTLPNGTANGLAFLNASKVLTTGSALTFDGTDYRNLAGAVASGGSVNGKFRLDRSDGATNLGYIDWVTSGDGLRFFNNNGGYFSWQQSAAGELMRLTSTGLGIGASSPAYKLDVRGNVAGGNGTIATGLSWDTNGLVGTFTNHSLGIMTNSSVVARFDTSGNLGLGVTPSAWSRRAFQIAATAGDAAYLACSSGTMVVANNVRYNSGDFYINSTNATYYAQQTDGKHVWATAPSGTAGNAISFTQAMTLDASGNLLLGTTSVTSVLNAKLYVNGGINLPGNTDISGTNGLTPHYGSGSFIIYSGLPGSGTERARIDSSGNLLVGTTNGSGKIRMKQSADSHSNTFTIENFGNTNAWSFLIGSDNNLYFGYNGTSRGVFNNSTGAYTTISDRNLKKNITEITYGLASVLALRPVSYLMKDQDDGVAKTLGFIAQEVDEVVPESVFQMREDAYGMDKSALIPVLVKAIQELKASLDEVKLEFDAYKAAHP